MKVKKNLTKKEYSKNWLDRWQYFVMFWLSVFYVIDIIKNDAIHLETLSITLVTSIIAVIVPYFVKSYFGKKQEEIVRLQEKNDVIEDSNESMEG